MGVKVIPVSDAYRKNYDRIFRDRENFSWFPFTIMRPDYSKWHFDPRSIKIDKLHPTS
jgi:hypothetical protein